MSRFVHVKLELAIKYNFDTIPLGETFFSRPPTVYDPAVSQRPLPPNKLSKNAGGVGRRFERAWNS